MIYLITGVPGSGKTLYAVSTFLKKFAAEKIKGRDGVVKDRRICVDGITGLLLPHEKMADGIEQADGSLLPGEGHGVWNWFEWCKPGDVIVIDEVQRWWRPRGMGSKPPKMIQALETHRHLGMDFVVITQNPMLIDQNVRRLVGRHQHVRRLMGMARAVIYDWDACSMDVNRTKTATTTMWAYPKKAFDLYKSSELHTKQRQKVPLWLAVPVLALIAGLFVAPMAFGTMKGAMTGKGIGSTASASAPARPASAPVVVASLPVSGASAPVSAASAPLALAGLAAPVEAPRVAGCIAVAKKCGCVDSEGLPAAVAPGYCEARILGNSTPGQKVDLAIVPDEPDYQRSADDAVSLAFIVRNRQIQNQNTVLSVAKVSPSMAISF